MFQLQSELKLIQNSHHIIPIPEDIGSEIHAKLGKRVICEVNGKIIPLSKNLKSDTSKLDMLCN